jgi:hypothetical protein
MRKESRMKIKTGFFCESCLRKANVGHYIDQHGTCVICGNKDDGHVVSKKDLKDAYQLGEDENGWYWVYVLPGYNVATTDCICPRCGHNAFDRINPGHQRDDSPIYKCNCCSHPIHTGTSSSISQLYSEYWAKNSSDIKKWIKFNKIIVRPGETYSVIGNELRLISDVRTCFFIDKKYEVVGKMLTINTVKSSRVLGVSQRVIDCMFWNDFSSECRWTQR